MKDSFDIDNPFFAFMGGLADIVIVNLLFLVCSIPVVTIGASISAMYQTIGQLREGGVSSVCRAFMGAFKSSFKKSVPAWLLQLITGIVLIFDLFFVGMMPKAAAWSLIGMVTGGMALLWLFLTCYLIPAGIYDGRKLKEALPRSLYLAVRNLPYTAVMALLNSIPIVCIFLGTYFIGVVTPIYLLAGFGITAYFNTMLLEKCRDLHIAVSE